MKRPAEIDAYLATLASYLVVERSARRRFLREVEDHLVQATLHGQRSGLSQPEAARLALERFGDARTVAEDFSRTAPKRALRRPKKVASIVVFLALVVASVSFATATLDKPVLGVLLGGDRTVTRPGRAILYRPPATTLVRVDPRTLRPQGRPRVRLPAGSSLYARSPDGSRLVAAGYEGTRLRLVDVARMRSLGDLALPARRATNVRALGWVRSDRLLAVLQTMGGPYNRQVVARTLAVIDPTSRRVIARRALAKTAVRQSLVAGERLVLVQADSNHRNPRIRLVVADASGNVRSRELRVGAMPGFGMRRGFSLAAEPSGKRAFVVVSFGRVIEVELDSLSVRDRRPRRVSTTPQLHPTAWSLSPSVASVGRSHLAVGGLFARTVAGRTMPIPGVWLLDTRAWTARLLDPRARDFLVTDETLLTYGYAAQPLTRRFARTGRGVGVTAYNLDGRRRYHVYGSKLIQRVVVVGGYLHTLASPVPGRGGRLVQPPRAVFDLRTGRNLGKVSRPPLQLRLVDEKPY